MGLSLYNALAAGVSLAGDTFCYVTPLASRGDFKYMPELLGGVTVIKGQGLLRPPEDWKEVLYRPAPATTTRPLPVTAVPYCVWENRGLGKMAVWIDATR